MNERKQQAIKRHYAKLVDCLNPLRVMDRLAYLLLLEEMELIRKSQFTPQERTRELIAIILRKNEELRPFDCFIEALKKTDENHKTMAEAILKTYKHENGANVAEKVPSISHLDAGETEDDLKM
uniref:CARD domain-containing protein n=1 Tax=Plectus sambesii TaxID=2011161 RepID=A0A914XAE4_9BILA